MMMFFESKHGFNVRTQQCQKIFWTVHNYKFIKKSMCMLSLLTTLCGIIISAKHNYITSTFNIWFMTCQQFYFWSEFFFVWRQEGLCENNNEDVLRQLKGLVTSLNVELNSLTFNWIAISRIINTHFKSPSHLKIEIIATPGNKKGGQGWAHFTTPPFTIMILA